MVQEFQLDSMYAGYTVSEGTLKTKDLIYRFEGIAIINALPTNVPLDLMEKFLSHPDSDDWYDTEEASLYLNEDLFPFLESIAPEGCYFGTLEGDGACFGFWPLEEE